MAVAHTRVYGFVTRMNLLLFSDYWQRKTQGKVSRVEIALFYKGFVFCAKPW